MRRHILVSYAIFHCQSIGNVSSRYFVRRERVLCLDVVEISTQLTNVEHDQLGTSFRPFVTEHSPPHHHAWQRPLLYMDYRFITIMERHVGLLPCLIS
jgi:hypothetical protein